jgi:hypothetical protein
MARNASEKERFSLDKRDTKYLGNLIIIDSIIESYPTLGILPDLGIHIKNLY